MSILIKGMEMPESCDMCAFSSYIAEGDDHEELWYCILDNWNQITPILLTKDTVSNGRSMDCPLIELAPHGRLIDADAILGKINAIISAHPDEADLYEQDAVIVRDWLRSEPTIIEAEEGE